MTHSVKDLEARINAAHHSVNSMGGDDFTEQMLAYIHHPGFTTPRELMMLTAMLESVETHSAALASMRTNILAAAAAIVENASVSV